MQPASEPSPLAVLYQDDVLLAVDKPSGMLVHRERFIKPLEPVLVELARQVLGVDVVYPLHRLDRGTSGVVLIARDEATARVLGGFFERHAVDKRYLALVRGHAPSELVIDHPIPRRQGGPRVPALTVARSIAAADTAPRAVSLLDVRPRTGRRHQIRRHLKYASFPIIGDSRYGRPELNRALAEGYGLTRLALHAAGLSLLHPVSGARLTLEAPLPPDLREPFARMGLDLPDDSGARPS